MSVRERQAEKQQVYSGRTGLNSRRSNAAQDGQEVSHGALRLSGASQQSEREAAQAGGTVPGDTWSSRVQGRV